MLRSPIDPFAEKKELRRQILEERRALPPEEKRALDASLCVALTSLPEWENCRLLLCYSPVRGEIDLLPIARQALLCGKQVAFPISHTDRYALSFHPVESLDELTAGAYGIPEPPASREAITDFSGALCLVPALAFDRDGYRLGYGKGYYDRFLSEFCGISLGLVYTRFLRDRLPRAETDRAVNRILTEKGAL